MGDLIGDVVEVRALLRPAAASSSACAELNAAQSDLVALFADMARLNALYMIARAGSGHIGSSFSRSTSSATSISPRSTASGGDVFFSSKGHDAPALYAVLIAEGMLPEEIAARPAAPRRPSRPSGYRHARPRHQYRLARHGHLQGQGHVGAADRPQGEAGRVFVMTGDGELQEGQIWESLVSAANRRTGELTVDRRPQQVPVGLRGRADLEPRRPRGEVPRLRLARRAHATATTRPRCETRFARAARRHRQAEGHHRRHGEGQGRLVHGRHLDRFRRRDVPLPLRRAESRRVPARASRRSSDASPSALAAIGRCRDRGRARRQADASCRQPPNQARLFPAYTEALLAAAERRPNLVALDADLVLDMGLIPFAERFPDRFFECGIAEQDMVSQAGGMALAGCCRSFTPSPASCRPARTSRSTTTRPSARASSMSADCPASCRPGPGHSHQSVREISAARRHPQPGDGRAVLPGRGRRRCSTGVSIS